MDKDKNKVAALPQRDFGRTGRKVSIVAFPGLAVNAMAQPEADKLVAEAVKRGVNYFDVAPSYGNAQDVLGPALQPFREKVFLSCKTLGRTAHAAREELAGSLKALRTDRLDLYQFHAVNEPAEIEAIFAPSGAMETLQAARSDGTIRNIGFSSHSEPAALEMLKRFDFDSVMFPINYACWHEGRMGAGVVEAARLQGAACIALKALAKTRWQPNVEKGRFCELWYQPNCEPAAADLALRWTLSLPITAAIPPGDAEMFRLAVDIASRFAILTADQQAKLATYFSQVQPLFG